MISSAELKIDDKVIPLDKNGVAINIGMKIGSKISLKLKKAVRKLLRLLFQLYYQLMEKRLCFIPEIHTVFKVASLLVYLKF
jgi:hypothetical protein